MESPVISRRTTAVAMYTLITCSTITMNPRKVQLARIRRPKLTDHA